MWRRTRRWERCVDIGDFLGKWCVAVAMMCVCEYHYGCNCGFRGEKMRAFPFFFIMVVIAVSEVKKWERFLFLSWL
jgi:hypothetical protein